jgi:ABC-type multidrug transport system fused ATPase/permease subunit
MKNQSLMHHPLISLVVDMLRVLCSYPGWFIAAIISTVVVASVEPSLAWMGKSFVDGLKKGNAEASISLIDYLVKFGGLLFGLGIIKFCDKIIDKIFELKLVIRLQRVYLERRGQDRGMEDVSRVIFDCNRAKAGLDIIHKDSWKIVFQTISVIVWQLTLAPEWLPALVIAVVPPVLIGFVFGKFIQRTSLNLLRAQENIASTTREAQRLEFFQHQQTFFQQTIRMEMFKSGTEILMDLLTWFGLLVLVILASTFHWGIVPKDIQAGDLLLFYVNLNLLSKPLSDIVKVYNKGREAYPALIRVLRPVTE